MPTEKSKLPFPTPFASGKKTPGLEMSEPKPVEYGRMPVTPSPYPVVSDQTDPYDLWKKDPSPANTSLLLRKLDPVLDRGIQMHLGAGHASPIVKSKAKLLAVNALKTFDPNQASLNTHVTNALQGLKRYSRKRQQAVYVPERLSLQAAMLQRASAELEEELDREPTDEELLDYTGITEKRLAAIRRSQQATITEGQLSQALAASSDGDGAIDLPAIQQRDDALLKFVYADLSPSNKKIMEWTFGLNGQRKRSNDEIAKKLGVSPGAVSQRRATIQKRLDMAGGLKAFR